jgi:hypothetical protein
MEEAMAKAKGEYTPERQARVKIEGAAAYTPEQQALIKKAMEGDAAAFEAAAEADKDRKTIDRSMAIRDGLIPPPWAVELEAELVSLRKATALPQKRKSKPKRVQDRIKEVLPSLPNPLSDGRFLANLTNKELARELEPGFRQRNWPVPSEDSVRRARRSK